MKDPGRHSSSTKLGHRNISVIGKTKTNEFEVIPNDEAVTKVVQKRMLAGSRSHSRSKSPQKAKERRSRSPSKYPQGREDNSPSKNLDRPASAPRQRRTHTAKAKNTRRHPSPTDSRVDEIKRTRTRSSPREPVSTNRATSRDRGKDHSAIIALEPTRRSKKSSTSRDDVKTSESNKHTISGEENPNVSSTSKSAREKQDIPTKAEIQTSGRDMHEDEVERSANSTPRKHTQPMESKAHEIPIHTENKKEPDVSPLTSLRELLDDEESSTTTRDRYESIVTIVESPQPRSRSPARNRKLNVQESKRNRSRSPRKEKNKSGTLTTAKANQAPSRKLGRFRLWGAGSSHKNEDGVEHSVDFVTASSSEDNSPVKESVESTATTKVVVNSEKSKNSVANNDMGHQLSNCFSGLVVKPVEDVLRYLYILDEPDENNKSNSKGSTIAQKQDNQPASLVAEKEKNQSKSQGTSRESEPILRSNPRLPSNGNQDRSSSTTKLDGKSKEGKVPTEGNNQKQTPPASGMTYANTFPWLASLHSTSEEAEYKPRNRADVGTRGQEKPNNKKKDVTSSRAAIGNAPITGKAETENPPAKSSPRVVSTTTHDSAPTLEPATAGTKHRADKVKSRSNKDRDSSNSVSSESLETMDLVTLEETLDHLTTENMDDVDETVDTQALEAMRESIEAKIQRLRDRIEALRQKQAEEQEKQQEQQQQQKPNHNDKQHTRRK